MQEKNRKALAAIIDFEEWTVSVQRIEHIGLVDKKEMTEGVEIN